MKTLKAVLLIVLISLTTFLGAGSATASELTVGDYFNSARNASGAQSLPSDAKLNALAQRSAETGNPVNGAEMPPGDLGYTTYFGEGTSNQVTVDYMKTKSPHRGDIPNAKWTVMGYGSAVRSNGLTYGVVIVATYPAPVAMPAPAPVPVTQPPVKAPVQQAVVPQAPVEQAPAPVVEEPPVEPAPAPVAEEAPKEEVSEAPKVTATPSPEPSEVTATPTPEPSETVIATVDDNTPVSSSEGNMTGVFRTATGIMTAVFALSSLLSLVMFIRHRRMSLDPQGI